MRITFNWRFLPMAKMSARAFYGEILGLREKPKPEHLVQYGGVCFDSDNLKLHLGVVSNFCPVHKAPSGVVS
jgi:hypothetical protein